MSRFANDQRAGSGLPAAFVTNVAVTLTPDALAENGIVAFASVDFAGVVRVDSIRVRRTAGGELLVMLPEHRDRIGARHPIVTPMTLDVLREIRSKVKAKFIETLAAASARARFERESDAARSAQRHPAGPAE